VPATYELTSSALDGTNEQIIEWSELHMTFVLDDAGTCDFVIANREDVLTNPDFMALGRRIVKVYRNGGEDPFWAGRLWRCDVGESATLHYYADGWFSVLKRRYIEPTDKVSFDDPTGVWDVAWALITYAQDIFDEGITRIDAGDGNKTIQPEFWWHNFQSIGDHLQWLASQPWGAWDFYVTPTRGWKTIQRHNHNTDLVLEQGVNVEKVTYVQTAENSASQMIIIGIGSGKDVKYGIDTNGPAETDWGHLTGTLDRRNTKIQEYLDDAAVRQSAIRSSPQTQPTVFLVADAVNFDDLRLGENYQISYTDRIQVIDDEYRLVSIDFTVNDSNHETVQCLFDAKWDEIDFAEEE
jgi:hypothetical protein